MIRVTLCLSVYSDRLSRESCKQPKQDRRDKAYHCKDKPHRDTPNLRSYKPQARKNRKVNLNSHIAVTLAGDLQRDKSHKLMTSILVSWHMPNGMTNYGISRDGEHT